MYFKCNGKSLKLGFKISIYAYLHGYLKLKPMEMYN